MTSEPNSPLSSPSPSSVYYSPAVYPSPKAIPQRIFFPSAPTTPAASSLQKRRKIRPLQINTQFQSKSAPASPCASDALEALADKANRTAMDIAIVPRQGSKATVSATFVWMKNGKRTTWRLSKEFFIPQGGDVKECQKGWEEEIQKQGQELFDKISENTQRDLASYKSFDIEPSKEKEVVTLRFPATEAAEEKPFEEISSSDFFNTFFENIQTVSALKEAANTSLCPTKPLPPKPFSSSKGNKVPQSPIDDGSGQSPITEFSTPETLTPRPSTDEIPNREPSTPKTPADKTPNDETPAPKPSPKKPPEEDSLDSYDPSFEEMQKKMADEHFSPVDFQSLESPPPQFTPLVGVENTGNTCYLATAFQQIATNPLLRKAFLEDAALPKNHPIKRKLLEYALKKDGDSINIDTLRQSLGFKKWVQYDASETLNLLITAMNLNSSSLAIERQEIWTYTNEKNKTVAVPTPPSKIFPFFQIMPRDRADFIDSISALTCYSGAGHEQRKHLGTKRQPEEILQTFYEAPKTAIFQVKTQEFSQQHGATIHRDLVDFPKNFGFPLFRGDPKPATMHLRGFGLHLAVGEKVDLGQMDSPLSTSSISANGGHWVSFTREFSQDGLRYVCYNDARVEEISKAVFDRYLKRASFLVYNRESP